MPVIYQFDYCNTCDLCRGCTDNTTYGLNLGSEIQNAGCSLFWSFFVMLTDYVMKHMYWFQVNGQLSVFYFYFPWASLPSSIRLYFWPSPIYVQTYSIPGLQKFWLIMYNLAWYLKYYWCNIYHYLPSFNVGTLAKYTGGQVCYYPGFQSAIHGEKLRHELARDLTRETAWESVMRIRCGKGHPLHDNFYPIFNHVH